MRRVFVAVAVAMCTAGGAWAGPITFAVTNDQYTLVSTIPGVDPSVVASQPPSGGSWQGTLGVGTEINVSYDMTASWTGHDSFEDYAYGRWGWAYTPTFPSTNEAWLFFSGLQNMPYWDAPIITETQTLRVSFTVSALPNTQDFEIVGFGQILGISDVPPIPEPSTWALMLGGAIALAVRRHRPHH